jgi:hypothetical protein
MIIDIRDKPTSDSKVLGRFNTTTLEMDTADPFLKEVGKKGITVFTRARERSGVDATVATNRPPSKAKSYAPALIEYLAHSGYAFERSAIVAAFPHLKKFFEEPPK